MYKHYSPPSHGDSYKRWQWLSTGSTLWMCLLHRTSPCVRGTRISTDNMILMFGNTRIRGARGHGTDGAHMFVPRCFRRHQLGSFMTENVGIHIFAHPLSIFCFAFCFQGCRRCGALLSIGWLIECQQSGPSDGIEAILCLLSAFGPYSEHATAA